MWVEIGSESMQHGYRNPYSADPEQVEFRPLEGQRTLRLEFPAGIGLQEAFYNCISTMTVYVLPEGDSVVAPSWIDSDSIALRTMLCNHFGLPTNHVKPDDWGWDA